MKAHFHSRSAKKFAAIVGLLAFCLIAGCCERVTDGDTSIYRYERWVGASVVAGGILTLILGWAIRKASPKWGNGVMCLGPVVLALIAPMMYNDYILIDDDHFEAASGFWFRPVSQNVRFGDLREIQFTGVPRGLGKIDRELRCVPNSGQTTVVTGGDLIVQSIPEILLRAKAKGVRVVNVVP